MSTRRRQGAARHRGAIAVEGAPLTMGVAYRRVTGLLVVGLIRAPGQMTTRRASQA